jgi:hypothetical protein
LRFRSSICAWRAAMNLRIAGRKQPWKSRHFNQTRFDFLIVALAGVFIAGKVMQTKGLTEKKAARKLRLGAGTEAEEKPARLVSVMAGRLVLSLPSATFRFRGEVFASVRENLESNSFAVDLLGSLGFGTAVVRPTRAFPSVFGPCCSRLGATEAALLGGCTH